MAYRNYSRNENTSNVLDRKIAGTRRAALGDRTNQINSNRTYLGTKKTTTKRPSALRKAAAPAQAPVAPTTRVVPPVAPFATPAREIPHDDIDADEVDDPQACTEYIEEIMHHFREKELVYLAPPNYMSTQRDINEKMRAILIDWLIEVHLKFKLLQETLYLTINVIDRFLAVKPVMRNKLQLVGITSMLIASKYEEIYAPEVRDFIYICDKAYSRSEILNMEQLMLNTLGFKLLPPYPLHFLRRFSKASKADLRTHTLAKYLVELTLVEYKCVKYLPSTVAASALCIALKCTGINTWDSTLEHYSHYTEEQLAECMQTIHGLQKKQSGSSSLTAVYKKYSTSKFLEVAKMPPPNL